MIDEFLEYRIASFLEEGDQVVCIFSRIPQRVGAIYTVRLRHAADVFQNKMVKSWLVDMERQGDIFERVEPKRFSYACYYFVE